jgi:iron-sulfur cluster assembly protein
MPITLTEAAATRVKRYLGDSEKGVALRLGVKTMGCSGLAYVVDITDAITPNDCVFESREVKIVVEQNNLRYVDGTEIDFSGDRMSESFQFRNPNVKSECGCGESFGI